MIVKYTSKISYLLALIALSVGAILSFTDCRQMDLTTGQVRWVKEIYGLPLLYFYEDSAFASKVRLFELQASDKPVWVTDSRLSFWFDLDNASYQFHGIIWNCDMACRLMDTNYVSVEGQKTFVAYTLQQLSKKQIEKTGSYSAQELIDLCGGVISVEEQVNSIPLTADMGNLLECFIESQYAPQLIENFYYSQTESYANRFSL